MTSIDSAMPVVKPVPAGNAAEPAAAKPSEHHFSFSDLLDVINPLQHIPVVSTIYRAITGDKIGTVEKITGDTLFGGVMGFVSSLADTAFESLTGKNFGDTVLSLFESDDKTKPQVATAELPQTQLALDTTAPKIAFAEPAAAPGTAASPSASSLKGAEAITAALNRAQISPAIAARVAFAYGRAVDLTQAKTADGTALAY